VKSELPKSRACSAAIPRAMRVAPTRGSFSRQPPQRMRRWQRRLPVEA
jgi:hypothetical protein